MFLSIAIASGLVVSISTVLVFASCFVSANANRTMPDLTMPDLTASLHNELQPQEGLFTFANSAA